MSRLLKGIDNDETFDRKCESGHLNLDVARGMIRSQNDMSHSHKRSRDIVLASNGGRSKHVVGGLCLCLE